MENRCLFVECDPEHCKMGERCSNQRFQRREEVEELEVFWVNNPSQQTLPSIFIDAWSRIRIKNTNLNPS